MRPSRIALISTLIVSGVLVGSCQEDPAPEVTLLRMDLRPCIGAIESSTADFDAGTRPVPSTCRDSLDRTVDVGSTVNACFVMREANNDNAPIGRLAYHWEDGAIARAIPGNLDLAPGQSLTGALYFLTQGGDDLTVCSGFQIDTDCAANDRCALKLFEEQVTPAADGSTVFDFTNDDDHLCNAESGPAFVEGNLEICDDLDNDCDRLVDEGFDEKGDRCTTGTGACEQTAVMVCNSTHDGLRCGEQDIEPTDEVCGEGVDE
ncbi:MAG: hypothetical protein KC620_16970, partial [Myxococcales bacterium]|nr:hypothetical protein [Myxococcales bacterium]